MEHGIFTDAVSRFNKGQSPWQCPAVLYQAARMVEELSPGSQVIGDGVDNLAQIVAPKPVEVSALFISERLGVELTGAEIMILLKNVEFQVDPMPVGKLLVTAPFWRTDIEIPEDVVEEVGRLYGYDKLPLTLPLRDLTPAVKDQVLSTKADIRDRLSRMGANEVLTYSFVHGQLLTKVGQDAHLAFQLSNALSPDLQYYRLSLSPSLLDKVHANSKAGYDQFALFELGKVHAKSELNDEGLPAEFDRLALVFAADDKKAATEYNGAAYYQARNYLTSLLAVDVEFVQLSAVTFEGHVLSAQMAAPFEPNRSAAVMVEGRIVGVVGEYKASVRRALKLPAFCAGFELFLSIFNDEDNQPYQPLPRFPKVAQDITLKVSSDVSYGGLYDLLSNELQVAAPAQTYAKLMPLGIYQKDEDSKNLSFRLEIASYERTLTADEVNRLLDSIAKAAGKALKAERI